MFVLFVSMAALAQSPYLVADINSTSGTPPSSNPLDLTAVGDLVFFTATDGIDGRRIWRSNGISAGTFTVSSLDPTYPSVSMFTSWHGALYFVHQFDGLWQSDGTVAGTTLLKGFSPSENIDPVFAANDLYFGANGFVGEELWRSDGTSEGTVRLSPADHSPLIGPSGFSELAGRVYLAAQSSDPGIWVTEGTNASTRRLIHAPQDGSLTTTVAAAGAIFYALTTDAAGRELWRSDGSMGDNRLVKDIAAGNASSDPDQLTAAGRYLYFVANDGVNGAELWRSDGTAVGTILLKDIAPGSASSAVGNLTAAAGSLLYFTADDGAHGAELWRSDGTPAGTEMVADLRAGSASSNPQGLVFAHGDLWFSADDGSAGDELWHLTNGVPAMVADLEPGPGSSSPAEIVQAGQLLFFAATTSLGRELWAIPLTDPVIDIDDVRITEGTGGAQTVRFTVTRSGSTTASSSVDFTTEDGTATGGVDYVARAGTLTFAEGETSQFIDIDVQPDAELEENEAFFVLLSSPVGAVVGKSTGAAVIEDDDHRAELSIEFVPSLSSDDSIRAFRITNAGPSTATGIQMKYSESPFKMDLGIEFRTSSENPITCTLNESLLPGASMVVTAGRQSLLLGVADPSLPPGRTVTASIAANELENDLSDNVSSVMVDHFVTAVLPPFLTTGSTSIATYRVPTSLSVPNTVSFTSSDPNVVVTDSLMIPMGQATATFTLVTGPLTGSTLLTIHPQGTFDRQMLVPVVAPGTLPKLDVALAVSNASVDFGDPVMVDVEVAARRHDGTRPTGLVTLFQDDTVVAQQSVDENGVAAFTFNDLPAGSTFLRASYEGDANFNPLEGPGSQIEIHGWPTTLTLAAPPLLCSGSPQQISVIVSTSATTAAPTGEVAIWIDGALTTVPVFPTGAPGESRATLQHSFSENPTWVSARFISTEAFEWSSVGQFLTVSPCLPLQLQATATSTTTVALNWTAKEAHHYDIYRSSASGLVNVGSTPSTNYVDTVAPMSAYLYAIRAADSSGNTIGWSNPDAAMTMFFDDDPLVPGVTLVRAVHVEQLRTAANGLRSLGSISTSIASVPIGSIIQAADITALRNDITSLRRALGLPDVAFTDPSLAAGSSSRPCTSSNCATL